jgi:hypothetical protein
MDDIIADGISVIASGETDSDEIMFIPEDPASVGVEAAVADNRTITERRRNLVISANTTNRVIDQLETGTVEYIIMRVKQELPGGTDGADPGKLALFLQLDGYAQGGFEAIIDTSLGESVSGVTINTLSELNLPEQMGMWYLTVDQTDTKVVVFRARRPYNHRIRLELRNTDASSSIHVDFVEIVRHRRTAKEGGSNARGSAGDQLGY